MKTKFFYPLIGLLILWGLTACGHVSDPETSLISVTIGDAAHGGPDNRFYILPPLVEEPTYTGVFDADLTPTITIPALDIEFTTEVIQGAEYIRVSPDDELYIVNWKTESFDLTIPGIYRISFNLDGEEVGFIEIQVFETPGEVLSQGDEIATIIQPGRTVPIKFRIEKE